MNIAAALGLLWLIACSQSAAVRTRQTPEPPPVAKHPEADFSISCFECHEGATPEITAEWSAGKHGQVNVGCFVCHGDGEIEFFAKPSGDNCMGCHSAYEVDFAKQEVKSCFSCHGGHDLKFHN